MLVQYNFYLHFSYEIALKFCETNAIEKLKKNMLEVYFTFTIDWFKLFVLDYIYPSSFIHTFSTHLCQSQRKELIPTIHLTIGQYYMCRDVEI